MCGKEGGTEERDREVAVGRSVGRTAGSREVVVGCIWLNYVFIINLQEPTAREADNCQKKGYKTNQLHATSSHNT